MKAAAIKRIHNIRCSSSKRIFSTGGWTLLEMLMAISILSVIVVVSVSFIVSGMRVYRLNEEQIRNQYAGRIAMMYITRDLRRFDTDTPKDNIRFEEDYATGDQYLRIGEALMYHLRVSSGTLVRIDTPEGQPQEETVIPGISNISVVWDSQGDRFIEIEVRSSHDGKVLRTKIVFRGNVN